MSSSSREVDVTVVAVCRGDGPVLEAALDLARGALEGAARRWRFVFVDDGTQDGTFGRLLEAARGEPRIGVMRQDRPRGFGAALRAGLARSDARVLCAAEVGPDFSPERLVRLVRRIEDGGADVATVGSTDASGWACALRTDRLRLGRTARLAAGARLAVQDIASRALRAGLRVDAAEVPGGGESVPAGLGVRLRKFGMAVMARGGRPGAPKRAA